MSYAWQSCSETSACCCLSWCTKLNSFRMSNLHILGTLNNIIRNSAERGTAGILPPEFAHFGRYSKYILITCGGVTAKKRLSDPLPRPHNLQCSTALEGTLRNILIFTRCKPDHSGDGPTDLHVSHSEQYPPTGSNRRRIITVNVYIANAIMKWQLYI